MDQEARNAVFDLAEDLTLARSAGTNSPILFLGAGASTIYGHPFIDELQRQVLLTRYPEAVIEGMSRDDQVNKFDQRWPALLQARKDELLRTLYGSLVPTEGHRALALLLQERYLSLVVTTTFDQLIELSFSGPVQQVKSMHLMHLLTVLENGRDSADAFKKEIEFSSGITVFKLLGNSRTFAVTRAKTKTMLQDIEQSIKGAFKRALIIVGCTQFDDEILQSLFQSVHSDREGPIYFFNTEHASPGLKQLLDPWLQAYFVGPDMNFDLVFQTIAQQLNLFKQAEEEKGGMPLNKEESDRLRQATQSSRNPDEALAKFFKPDDVTSGVVSQSGSARQGTQGTISSKEETLVELLDNEQDEGDFTQFMPNELVELLNTLVLTVRMGSHKASVTLIGGKFNYSGPDSGELPLDLDELNWVMHDLGQTIATYHRMGQNEELRAKSVELRRSWRRAAKREGTNLYNSLIQAFPDLDRMLSRARQAAAQDDLENVTLVFEGPRQFLGMPFELLYYDGKPLVQEHPLCRKVTGDSGIYKDQHFDSFIQTLRNKQQLRVLLIASGTAGTTSDEQVLELQKLLIEETKRINLGATIDVLLTNNASVGEVRKRLQRSTYHIIHYAGHGVFDEETGENSGLRLWQRENQSGGQVTLTARELATMLRSSEVRLFCLNSCVGAETGSQQILRDSDYLGMMDALVRAEIPYVLGFRWYVTDRNSRKFALHFYQDLFKQRPYVPERAVLHARQHVYGENGDDETWTSPILVAQTPYQVTTTK